MRSLAPQYRLLLRAAFVVAIASVMGLNMPTQQDAVAQTNEDAYRQLSLFGDVFERVRGEYVEEKTDKELIEAAINGMLTSLDPHSSYLPDDNFEKMQVQTKGRFGGLGIEVTMDKGFVKVVSPIDDTPAAAAGLQPEDYIIAVDGDTQDNSAKSLNTSLGYVSGVHQTGVLFGANPEIDVSGMIKVDAGIDGGANFQVPPDLAEDQFMIMMDNRLGSIVDSTGKVMLRPVAIDDDNIATYLVSLSDGNNFVKVPSQQNIDSNDSPINGPLSATLEFKIKSSPQSNNSIST